MCFFPGTSNGAPVLGYYIYADGEKVHELTSGTVDQAIVEVKSSTSTISMRTRTTNDDLSIESESCKIPISVKAGLMRSFSAKEDDDSILRPAQQREVMINYSSGYPELDSDIGPSELSDIAEEPEEGLTSEDGSRGSTPKINNNHATSTSSTASITRWSSSGLYTSSSQTSIPTNNTVPSTNNTTTKVQINGSSSINGSSTINGSSSVKPKLKIRIFVALFDYDPPTMSPNPDACDEELPFREGQLIKVYGDKDAGN